MYKDSVFVSEDTYKIHNIPTTIYDVYNNQYTQLF